MKKERVLNTLVKKFRNKITHNEERKSSKYPGEEFRNKITHNEERKSSKYPGEEI